MQSLLVHVLWVALGKSPVIIAYKKSMFADTRKEGLFKSRLNTRSHC